MNFWQKQDYFRREKKKKLYKKCRRYYYLLSIALRQAYEADLIQYEKRPNPAKLGDFLDKPHTVCDLLEDSKKSFKVVTEKAMAEILQDELMSELKGIQW